MKRILIFSLAVLLSIPPGLFPQSIGMVTEDGGIRHLPSSTIFPYPSRKEMIVHLPEGNPPEESVAVVRYSLQEVPAEIEFRVYPADISLEEEFERIAGSMQTADTAELSTRQLQRQPRRRVSGPFEDPGIVCECSTVPAAGRW